MTIEEEEIVYLYKSGSTVEKMSKLLGVSNNKIYAVLKNEKVKMRKNKEPIVVEDKEPKAFTFQKRKPFLPVETINGKRYIVVNDEFEHF